MKRLISEEEAANLVKMIVTEYGYNPPIIKYVQEASKSVQYQVGYNRTVKVITGFWWWKKTVERITFSPVWAGSSWEDVLSKVDDWALTEAQPQFEKAEKLREKYGRQEADQAVDDMLKT